ncbi:MAG: AAA family ATPase, partial [Nitrospirota bacterium]|nr:AAA family ATPase [Nitrospirota bacterium]
MSYLVLARKWRPKNFDDIVGQDYITTTLRNAIHAGKTPHAMIMSGPRGVGKTSMARIVSKTLNCEKFPSDEAPCN